MSLVCAVFMPLTVEKSPLSIVRTLVFPLADTLIPLVVANVVSPFKIDDLTLTFPPSAVKSKFVVAFPNRTGESIKKSSKAALTEIPAAPFLHPTNEDTDPVIPDDPKARPTLLLL